MKETSKGQTSPQTTGVPRSILRAMEGAKEFLHSQLLKVPWLWRLDPTGFERDQILNSNTLRIYGKTVRDQINVSFLLHYADVYWFGSFFVKFPVTGKSISADRVIWRIVFVLTVGLDGFHGISPRKKKARSTVKFVGQTLLWVCFSVLSITLPLGS
jgi:hypothetical protein